MEGLNITMVQDHFLPDDEVQKRIDEQEKADKALRLRDVIKESEKLLKSPSRLTMDNFIEKPCHCWIGKTPATFEECKLAILAGSSAILSADTDWGKTHFAVAMSREIVKTGKTAMLLDDSTLATHAERDKYSDRGLDNVIDTASSVGVLILDDMGKTKLYYRGSIETTPYGKVAFKILNPRASYRRQTIVTTRGKNDDEIVDLLGDDFMRRVKMQENGVSNCVTIIAK